MSKNNIPEIMLFDEGSSFRKRSDERIFLFICGVLRFFCRGKKSKLEHGLIDFLYRLRKDRLITKLLGRVNRINYRRIEIDITYRCNLKCFNCDRSCTQAPSDISMSIEQIEKFIAESIAQKRNWELIQLLGGEPTLHPGLNKIIDLLLAYVHNQSPQTKIRLISNGFGREVEAALAGINPEVVIINTSKQTRGQKFQAFNIAPCDLKEYRRTDFTNGCPIIVYCGINLNAHGYYPCGAGGGIDRIFGFDIGKKSLPHTNEGFYDQLDVLCRRCGHFRWDFYDLKENSVYSASWQKAYKEARIRPPQLSRY